MNTFEEVLQNKNAFIGGAIRTEESGNYRFSSIIGNIKIEQGLFKVYTEEGTVIFANKDFGHVQPIKNGVSFSIPYIGRAYLYYSEVDKDVLEGNWEGGCGGA